MLYVCRQQRHVSSSQLQDVATCRQTILLACQLKIFRVVLQNN